MFRKPEAEAKPRPPPTCAVCGSRCSAVEVNFANLCDAHFEAYLASRKDAEPTIGVHRHFGEWLDAARKALP